MTYCYDYDDGDADYDDGCDNDYDDDDDDDFNYGECQTGGSDICLLICYLATDALMVSWHGTIMIMMNVIIKFYF